MTRQGSTEPSYHCAICELSFTTKADLHHHTANHVDISSEKLACAACGWYFGDSHALELHQIQSRHGTPQSAPPKPLNESLKVLAGKTDMAVTCNRCGETFLTQSQFNNHRSNMASDCADWRHTPPKHSAAPAVATQGYVDLDKPKNETPIIPTYEDFSASSEAGTIDSDIGVKCHDCKRMFNSMGHYNNHMLGCTPVPSATKTPKVPQATISGLNAPVVVHHMRQIPTPTLRVQPSSSTSPAPKSESATFICNANSCSRSFRSEAGLRQHKTDAHGVGGQALNLTGRDSWMLSNRERDRLRQEGQLQQPSASSRSRGGQRGRLAPRASPSAPRTAPPLPRVAPPVHRTTHVASPQPPHFARPMPTRPRMLPHVPLQQPVPMPASMNMGGAAELDQAKHIQAKILRLLIQSDIFIHHDGKINVCDIPWTRIGVARQHEVVAMFDTMCHLPKILQGEYVPAPKAFKDDYKAEYSSSDFRLSPAHNPAKPGLGVVALACSKVVLEGGRQEIVKIAAVDLITCRILMNHLVCTDPHAEVSDWRSTVTGLFSWKDMEAARKAGYKVFKGWAAARDALYRFVDKETIVVGHNLRSDLDSLRMIHGRAVDMAKVVEKAAEGPLSKAQLALDSLCRNYPAIGLKSDPEYGRDSLMNAFAVREFGLWVIKNKEKLALDARQKSRDYQMVMPRAAVAVA